MRTAAADRGSPPPVDEPGRIDVLFVGHATVRLDVDGQRVVTDPLLRSSLGPLQRHGPRPDAATLDGASVVLITHGHPDHLDPWSMRRLAGSPLVVVPRGLRAAVASVARGRVVELSPGAAIDVGRLHIEAVPARHWITPGAPRAQPIGYLVSGSTTTYLAGDTGRFPEMDALAGRVDLALLPVWTWGPHLGPGHLGPRSAAEVLRDLGAPAAVPVHWGTLYPRRLHHVWNAPLREPGDRFAEHASSIAPHADVRVLRPGDATTFALAMRTAPAPRSAQ